MILAYAKRQELWEWCRDFIDREAIYWEHEGNRAVRSGSWKLVSTYPNEWELYDMAADRVERNDVAARHPDIVRTLAAAWEAWARRANVDSWEGPRRLPWGDDAPLVKPAAR